MYYYISNPKANCILSYIKEPNQKLYFCNVDDTDIIKCTDNIDVASRFIRNSALDIQKQLLDFYGLNFNIESYIIMED